ncbi:hypothetical protein DH2020_031540 [Rehmannia glutinosa]|uniref:Hexosyltransferase n=1 Tax=Rehmannia glutinosa TaxID=99300 RepID=A0ABR0VKS3_REHGL
MSMKNRGGEQVSRSTVISQRWTLFLCLASFCSGLFFTNRTLDKKISNLEMELAAAKAAQESILSGSPTSEATKDSNRKYFMVIGINTAFSSRKRRDSVRATWMPQAGEKRRKLESEKGIIVRFVIGHSATLGGILDRAIEAEDQKHGDIMRLDHVEATLGETLARHRKKPRVYIGCMKSGPVLSQRGVRYHEPEFWKFGETGNKYFRHATGQLYAISKDLASYISVNQHVLHKYANEDVSLGSWFIGLDIVNGKHRQATSVLLHLIGAVVGYAGQSKG